MKIKSRALNENERFCCSQKDVRNIFKDKEISVHFGYFQRDFDTNPKFNKVLKIKGKIIASLGILNIETRIGRKDNTILCFYVLKSEEFSEELRQEFVSNILPQMYDEFIVHENENPGNINGTYHFEVELYEGKFILHQGIN